MPPVTPNALAWLALATWPLVALAVFAARRRSAPVAATTAWLLLLPTLFLPSNLTFKIPGIPGLDKYRIALLSVTLILGLLYPRSLRAMARGHVFARLVLLVLVVGIIGTVRTNPDPLRFGPTVLPGLTSYDALSLSVATFLDVYLPFTIGERIFRTERDLRDLFRVLSTCALIYAPFILFELRFSPQIHYWVYGYYPTMFFQAMRGDRYRPVVFMNHGLTVAMFLFSFLCAAVALERTRVPASPSPRVRAVAAGGLLLLSNSLGATVYGMGATLFAYLLSSKTLGRIVLLAAALTLAYPALRSADLFPANDVSELFSKLSIDRAQSLRFRFDQEQELLVRASERPVFGWGSWGRSFLHGDLGQMVSVPDGAWIIVLGSFGYVGFAAFFALMVVPLLRFWWYRALMAPRAQILVGSLAVMVAIFTIDLLPNSAPGFFPAVYAGALFGLSRGLVGRSVARTMAGSGYAPVPAEALATPGSPTRSG